MVYDNASDSTPLCMYGYVCMYLYDYFDWIALCSLKNWYKWWSSFIQEDPLNLEALLPR